MSKEADPAAVLDLDPDADVSGKDRGDEVVAEETKKPDAKKSDAKKPDKAAAKDDEAAEEEEDEGTEEGDDEEAEEEGEPADKKDGKRVPYERLAKATAARRQAEERAAAAERELQEVRASTTKAERSKYDELVQQRDALYDVVEEARANGDVKAAAKGQREIDGITARLNRAESSAIATQKASEARDTAVYNTLVAQLEAAVPEFDPESDEFDPVMAKEVDELVQAYEAVGKSPQAALRKAVKLVMGRDPFNSRPKAEEAKPAPKQAKKPDMAKAADTAKRQPAAIETREEAGEKIDTAQLSEEEFQKLPAKTKARLRGDFLPSA